MDLTPTQYAYYNELPATASDLAKKLNKKQPNVYNSLASMEDKGFVTQNPETKVWDKSSRTPSAPDLIVKSIQQEGIPQWAANVIKQVNAVPEDHYPVGSLEQLNKFLMKHSVVLLQCLYYYKLVEEGDYYDDDNPNFDAPAVAKKAPKTNGPDPKAVEELNKPINLESMTDEEKIAAGYVLKQVLDTSGPVIKPTEQWVKSTIPSKTSAARERYVPNFNPELTALEEKEGIE